VSLLNFIANQERLKVGTIFPSRGFNRSPTASDALKGDRPEDFGLGSSQETLRRRIVLRLGEF
jgi:hypothetical protein